MKASRSLAIVGLVAALGAGPARSQETSPSPELIAGIKAYNGGDFGTARRMLARAAEMGEAEAMVDYGYMLARGHGGPPNSAMALLFYRRAAALGDAEGMNALGYRYQFATPPDLDNAVIWYCRAVVGGNPRGMNNLAILLYNGTGVSRDQEEARSLWRQSAALGDINAATNLGLGLIFDPGRSAAERASGSVLLRQAARGGSRDAQMALRRLGDTEVFPPAIDTGLPMRLEPRPPVPGATSVCGNPVS